MRGTRPSAVAGLFYPGSVPELRAEVDRALDEAAARTGRHSEARRPPKAIVAPHAGYAYSGPIAGSAFAPWRPLHGDVERVVVIGPSHRVAFRGIALPASSAFASPLGEVALDLDAARELLAETSVHVDPRPHEGEHSIEVEIPFLQQIFGRFRLIPLVVGDAEADEVAAALDLVWGGPETRIVVSSDLSHFLSYKEARRVDAETAEEIVAFSDEIGSHQACGARALSGMSRCARRRGLGAEVLDLRNSGDVAGGLERVVGYGAIAYHEDAS